MTNDNRTERGLYWDRAWSLVEGCTKVSEGCDHCWAETQTAMRISHPNPKVRDPLVGMIDESREWSGMIRLRYDNLTKPLTVKKHTVWSVWNDLFHEHTPFEFVSQAFEVMGQAQRHTFLILTKRPQRMVAFIKRWERLEARKFDPDNVFLGVSVENQDRMNDRVRCITQLTHPRLFLSAEPMLGPMRVSLWAWRCPDCEQLPCSGDLGRWRFDGKRWQIYL